MITQATPRFTPASPPWASPTVASPRSERVAVSPRKWQHPELEVLQVRYRYRRSVMHVYAAVVWGLLAGGAYVALLHREALLARTQGAWRALSTLLVLFCAVSAALCLYRFLLPSVLYAGLDLTPDQRALAGLPPLGEAELIDLRERRAREQTSFLDAWLLWPSLVYTPTMWPAQAQAQAQAPRPAHRTMALGTPSSPKTASVLMSPLSPTAKTPPGAGAGSSAAAARMLSPEGRIRTSRELQQALLSEDRKKVVGVDVSMGQSAMKLHEYRTGYSTKTPDTQYGRDPAPSDDIARDGQATRARNVEANLDSWALNMRKWLAKRVFQPLVKRMDDVDARLSHVPSAKINGTLTRHQLEQMRDQLRAQLVTQQHQKDERELWEERVRIEQYVDLPGFKSREYVVQRLRELADDDWLSQYRWAAGGDFKGKPWSADCPTDAQLVYHVFCTFMDINMPCLYPHAGPQGQRNACQHRPFTDNYTRTRATLGAADSRYHDLCLYHHDARPAPRFTLLVRGPTKDTAWKEYVHIEAGRNNLFYALCLLAHYVATYMKGYLDFTDLGRDGLLGLLRVLDAR